MAAIWDIHFASMTHIHACMLFASRLQVFKIYIHAYFLFFLALNFYYVAECLLPFMISLYLLHIWRISPTIHIFCFIFELIFMPDAYLLARLLGAFIMQHISYSTISSFRSALISIRRLMISIATASAELRPMIWGLHAWHTKYARFLASPFHIRLWHITP